MSLWLFEKAWSLQNDIGYFHAWSLSSQGWTWLDRIWLYYTGFNYWNSGFFDQRSTGWAILLLIQIFIFFAAENLKWKIRKQEKSMFISTWEHGAKSYDKWTWTKSWHTHYWKHFMMVVRLSQLLTWSTPGHCGNPCGLGNNRGSNLVTKRPHSIFRGSWK